MKKIYLAILVIILLVAVLCLKISLTEYFQNEKVDILSMAKNLGIDMRQCKSKLQAVEKENSELIKKGTQIMNSKAGLNINNISKFNIQSDAMNDLIKCVTKTNNL